MSDPLIFQCNVCSAFNQCDKERLTREDSTCPYCGSAVRIRSMVHHVSMALYGMSLPIAQFPLRPDLRGIGLSDWDGYADRFAKRFNYTNTFFHTAPELDTTLDITQVPDRLAGTCDVLVSTDVFEHVLPPVSRAFDGAKKLLKPGGAFVFSVPFMVEEEETREHFPNLHEFELKSGEDGVFRLYNTCADGTKEVFEDLCFHGGPGTTLEMRLFALKSLQREFERAGFQNFRVESEFVPQYGIFWKYPWSIAMTATA